MWNWHMETIPKLGKLLIRRTLLILDYNPFLLKGKLNSFHEWRCSRFAPLTECVNWVGIYGGLLLIFEVGVTHYISVGNLRKEALWRGCYSLGTIRWSWVVFVFQSKSVTGWKRWDRAVFTGNLDEDSPGTRNCGGVRFFFLNDTGDWEWTWSN